MSIQAPQGILNIPNAILRVGKLSVDEVVGADTILNTVARNTILLVDGETYHENKNWSLKLPNAWAGEFECNTASAGNYSEFNFYNEGAASNAQGYNLTFNDTTVELRYDGTLLKTGTLASTVTGTGVRKVRLMFERTILSVTVDGALVFTHDDTGGPRPRVYSTTAGGFLNFFTNGGALKNLKIVNEKWMSDGTSNIAYVGGNVSLSEGLDVSGNVEVGTANLFVDTVSGRVGIGTTNPRASLDINNTGSLIVPIGTTVERPSTPVNGMIRFNTTTNAFECFYQPSWVNIFNFALYDFTSHTFTNAGQTGRTGPTLTQLTNAYTPTWTDDTNFLNVVTQGIQEWTVPMSGTYEIEVAGARGGFGGAVTQTEGSGGKGGWTKGQISLLKGAILKLIVGQAGEDASAGSDRAGGGGGASWVLSSDLATLYAVAGGGGGCNGPGYSEPALGGDGGSSQASVSDTAGGAQGPAYNHGGGAGFGGNGSGMYSTTQTGGYSPANGAMGGEPNTSFNAVYHQEGGFGGGGGAGAHGGGGGGGYAGGDAVAYNVTPGAYGGTTRNNMNLPTFDTHTGQHGYIKITLL